MNPTVESNLLEDLGALWFLLTGISGQNLIVRRTPKKGESHGSRSNHLENLE